jgi:hypothetical protein
MSAILQRPHWLDNRWYSNTVESPDINFNCRDILFTKNIHGERCRWSGGTIPHIMGLGCRRQGGQDGVVGVATRYGLEIQGSNTCGDERYSVLTVPGPHPASYPVGKVAEAWR